jgi:hypothetical protein
MHLPHPPLDPVLLRGDEHGTLHASPRGSTGTSEGDERFHPLIRPAAFWQPGAFSPWEKAADPNPECAGARNADRDWLPPPSSGMGLPAQLPGGLLAV